MRKKKSRDSYIKFKNSADRVMAGGRLKFLSLMMVKRAQAMATGKGIAVSVFGKLKSEINMEMILSLVPSNVNRHICL